MSHAHQRIAGTAIYIHFRKLFSHSVTHQVESELDVSRVVRQARPIYRVTCQTSTVPCPLRVGTAFNQVTDTFGKDQGQVRYLCCLTEFMVHTMRIDAYSYVKISCLYVFFYPPKPRKIFLLEIGSMSLINNQTIIKEKQMMWWWLF